MLEFIKSLSEHHHRVRKLTIEKCPVGGCSDCRHDYWRGMFGKPPIERKGKGSWVHYSSRGGWAVDTNHPEWVSKVREDAKKFSRLLDRIERDGYVDGPNGRITMSPELKRRRQLRRQGHNVPEPPP